MSTADSVCDICGELVTPREGTLFGSDLIHKTCKLSIDISNHVAKIQELIIAARKAGVIDESTEADLERLFRKVEDAVPDYL